MENFKEYLKLLMKDNWNEEREERESDSDKEKKEELQSGKININLQSHSVQGNFDYREQSLNHTVLLSKNQS